MSSFNNAITTLKINYQYPSCCLCFFKRDPLGCALNKYNNDSPTDKQILDVISVFIIYHRNDPRLAVFTQDIQQVSENKSLTATRVNQSICAWFILNKNGFLPEEYMDAIEKFDQLDALVSCLRVLDNLQCLDRRRFNALLNHKNQSTVISVLNKLSDAKLLNNLENLDAVLQLPYYANIEADAFFNGILVFDTQLKALPESTVLTQPLFNSLIDQNREQYGNVLDNANAYRPSIPTISNNNANRFNLLPSLGLLAVTPAGITAMQASVISGLGNNR